VNAPDRERRGGKTTPGVVVLKFDVLLSAKTLAAGGDVA
jgi:hypothetical protein